MSARLALISSDEAIARAIRSAIDSATSLMVLDHLPDEKLADKYSPTGILIDSNVMNGVQTAFERIEAAKHRFPKVPVIVLGNEMSAQLVLAALRAGADDFVDRNADVREINLALSTCIARQSDALPMSRAKIAGILGAPGSEQDQDFAINLAVRAAKRLPEEMTLYIDLSVPATQAGIALGVEPEFGLADAIRESARIDAALLESALARDPRSGLYVLPLCTGYSSQPTALEAGSFAALLQILQSCCSTIVINYGPLFRQRELLEMVRPSAHFFVCCNQRLPSIKGAGELVRWLTANGLGVPDVVVHELAPGSTPSPSDIRKALMITQSIDFDISWDELAESINSATPLALRENHYSRNLDTCLTRIGIVSESRTDFLAQLRGWLLPKVATRVS